MRSSGTGRRAEARLVCAGPNWSSICGIPGSEPDADEIKAHAVVRDTVFGYAAREIVSDAAGIGADVIVMGSSGRGDLAGLVLGSTAHKVIHLADRPVLVVR